MPCRISRPSCEQQLRSYAPPRDEPADFDAFWRTTLDEHRARPLDARFEPYDAGLRAVESDAFPHAHIFLGRIADLRGDRTAAEIAYRQALALPDAADSHAVARRLLQSPFTSGQLRAVVGGGK